MAQQKSPAARKGTQVADTDRSTAVPSAPYVSFASVLRVLEALRSSRPRDEDTRKFIDDLNKTCATHRIAALRFLGLLDADGVPTPALANMLGAMRTAAWPDTLALTIRTAFRPIVVLDLANMSLTQFVAAFARHYAGSDAVLRKSRTFFVHAAIQAKIPLSPGLARSAKPRAGDRVAEIGRNQPPAVAAPDRDHRGPLSDGAHAVNLPASLAVRLLSELDTHAMDDNVRQAFWTLLRHLKDRGI
jgi:hypothetical protein